MVIPSGVKVEKKNLELAITGPKGTLSLPLHPKVKINLTDKEINVEVEKQDDKRERALWGLFRALVQNQVDGVTKGYEKKLEVVGVGFKVAAVPGKLTLSLGFSHPVVVDVPKDLAVSVDKNTITISGADKQKVGQFAANIRELKKPEPYKGKGIKYSDEIVQRKAGKVVKVVGGGK